MSRLGLLVALVLGCSSNAPRAPSPQPRSQQPPPQQPQAPALAFAMCPKVDAPADPPLRPPVRVRPPLPGAFGAGGLQPRETPAKGATCQAARTTLDSTNAKILDGKQGVARGAKRGAWNRKSDPARWARVAQRFGLDERHRASLARDGFVVSDVKFWSYVEAYHEVFQSQLPIFVSIDSILHAIFASHAGVIGDVEKDILAPKVTELLSTMHCAMPLHAKAWPTDVARDVDLYLTVARSLMAGDPRYGKPVASVLGADARATEILKLISEAKGLHEIELFGRKRMVDFGAFQPRGRYGGAGETYFRAMTWLSRVELNLVSRGSRSSTMRIDRDETPREVAVALALVELARATNTLDTIASIDHVWGELAGNREDVSFAELDTLRSKAKIDRVALDAQRSIARAIGGRYQRTIPIQITPDGVTDLPVITAMFGARISPDASALAPIIQPAVPERITIGASDAGFILGHDRAKHHLANDLAMFPTLASQLSVARAALDAKLAGKDLYSTWLRAIRAIAKPPKGALPAFVKSDAYADLQLNSTIAAFGQLRSSYELMSGMAYLGSGCEIPDGYVEPAADVYDALIAYAERGKAILEAIDPQDKSKARQYFTRLGTTLRVLRKIVDTQLADQPLSAVQKQWLSMVVEIVVDNSGSGAPPTYAGWYFDLFRDFSDATADPDFITGLAQNSDTVFYAGARDPRMGVFVVDTGGTPRVVTGPIANAYETNHPTSSGRLTQHDIDNGKHPTAAPWAASFSISGAKPPLVDIQEEWDESQILTFSVTAPAAVGPITLRALDHHRVPIAVQTKQVGAGKTMFRFGVKRAKVEMVQLTAGKFHDWRTPTNDNGIGFHYLPRKDGSGE